MEGMRKNDESRPGVRRKVGTGRRKWRCQYDREEKGGTKGGKNKGEEAGK